MQGFARSQEDELLFAALTRPEPRHRAELAAHTTQDWVLQHLGEDHSPLVRETVAANTFTPGRSLRKLATDDVWEVRAATARNPQTPAATLELLHSDGDPNVRAAAQQNPSLPATTKI